MRDDEEKKILMRFRIIIPALFALSGAIASASDIAMDIRQTGIDTDHGGHFEIGLGYEYSSALSAEADGSSSQSNGIVVNLGGAYHYKGLFIEAALESYDGLNLGYQIVSNTDWSVDLLATSLSGDLSIGDESDNKTADQKLVERDSLYAGAGIRLTRYLGDYVLQGRIVSDIYKDNGVRASARAGRNWQLRNWNLHGIVSYDYASSKTMAYLVGITDEEATDQFVAYAPDAGSAISVELGAAYPISEHVVWNTRLLHTQYSDEVSQSSLLAEDQFTGFRTTLNYVF